MKTVSGRFARPFIFLDENTKSLRLIVGITIASIVAFTLSGYRMLRMDVVQLQERFPHYSGSVPLSKMVDDFFLHRILLAILLVFLFWAIKAARGDGLRRLCIAVTVIALMGALGYMQGMLLTVKTSMQAYTAMLFGLMAFTYIPLWLSTTASVVGIGVLAGTVALYVPDNPELTNILIHLGFISVLAVMISYSSFSRRYREVRKELELAASNQKLAERYRLLERMSEYDKLTEVTNRGYFDKAIQKVVANPAPYAVMLLDVDNFKKFNDTYGHVAGDDCLRRVAQAISQALSREGDTVSRYGGEEFGIILPATGIDGAIAVAERIRANIHALAIPHELNPPKVVTASIGVAVITMPAHGYSVTELLEHADRRLYAAKESGRNRVEWVSIEPEALLPGPLPT